MCGYIDIRDRAGLHAWLAAFDTDGAVDLLIANAGVSAGLGKGGSRETDEDAERLADINYKGTVNTISGIVESMRHRRSGQIAIISSLSGLQALPTMPSYSATKSALVAYGHSIRGWLRGSGVAVTIICPGFITSSMSKRHRGAKPFEVSVQDAVTKIKRGLEKRRPMIAFPWQLAFGIWLTNLIPVRLEDWIMKYFQANIDPDDGKPKPK